VICSLSFRRSDFIAWLNQQEEDAKGYIKVDILRAKSSGKIYGKVNDWTPGQQQQTRQEPARPAAGSHAQRIADEFGGEVVDSDGVPF